MKTRKEILATGKYEWMDYEFDSLLGLARVKNHDGLWGIVDTEGEEVVACQYKEMWKFIDKGYDSAIVVNLDNKKMNLSLTNGRYYTYVDAPPISRRRTYREFAGTYAQDVVGFSDEDICDAFDGDPSAYWNID